MALSEQSKERLGMVFEVVKTAFHWGFIPTVLYLGKNGKSLEIQVNFSTKFDLIRFSGFSKGAEPGMPPLSVASLLWQ
jgi:mitochondrial import receptor subunit TOM7